MKKILAYVVSMFASGYMTAALAAPTPPLPYEVQAAPAVLDVVITPNADQKADVTSVQECFFPQDSSNFNGSLEYTCAFQAFRNFHIDLTDSSKMAQFVQDWDPQNFANSDHFKTKEATFKLIRQMRDSLRNQEFPDHNLFDYVHTPEQVETKQKTDIAPVLQGGIGAMVKLKDAWQIHESTRKSLPEPDADFKNVKEYTAFMEKLQAAMIINPGHELIVDGPVKGSPSFGLLKDGDIIIGINGKGLNGTHQDAAVSKLRGDVGTSVTVQLQRRNAKGILMPFQLTLVRSTFKQHAVIVHDVDGIRYIKVENFVADNLLEDFHDALAGAKQASLKGVTIDMRGNPGGRIDYVIAMLEMIVPRGEILMHQERIKGSDKIKETQYVLDDTYSFQTELLIGDPPSHANASFEVRVPYTSEYGAMAIQNPGYVSATPLATAIDGDMPVTVLINGDSYSASEIFAGALQSTHRAAIFGQPSPGKGVVMTQLPLPDGGSVLVTSGRYFPGGLDSENIGILPDHEITQPADYGKTDAARDAANAEIEKLYQQSLLRDKEEVERVKINMQQFNETLDRRDAADRDPGVTDSGM